MKKFLLPLILCAGLAAGPVFSGEPVAPVVPESTAPVVENVAAPAPVVTTADTTEVVVPVTAPEADGLSIMPTVFEFIHLILGILGAAIATLVAFGIKKLFAKFGIQLSNEQIALAKNLAGQAIHYADAKAKAAADTPASDSKLMMALNFVKGHPEFINLAKKYSDEQLVDLIESTLGEAKVSQGLDL